MTIHTGDCLEVMAGMADASVDAVVTDPPYGLEFMGKGWDKFGAEVVDAAAQGGFQDGNGGNPFSRSRVRFGAGPSFQAWCEAWGREALRVTVPGGYLLAFGGTRTHHRLVCGLEDAGWIIRDELDWIYASGFPKGKANLKPAHEPIVLARKPGPLRMLNIDGCRIGTSKDWPASPSERAWPSVGGPTATMTVWEEGVYLCGSCVTDAASLGRRRTPATRVSTTQKPAEVWPSDPDGSAAISGSPATSASLGSETTAGSSTSSSTARSGRKPTVRSPKGTSFTISTETRPITGSRTCRSCGAISTATTTIADMTSTPSGLVEPTTNGAAANVGRWPSNIVLTDAVFDGGVDGVVGGGPSIEGSGHLTRGETGVLLSDGWGLRATDGVYGYGDSGTYSRFFLIPKADRADREPVLRGQLELGPARVQMPPNASKYERADGTPGLNLPRENVHPTVKPLELMRHLVRLVTPPGGTVLDPFLGSGTTAIACEMEGFAWVGIEKEPEYVAIAEARLNGVQRGLGLDTPLVGEPRKSVDGVAVRRNIGISKRGMFGIGTDEPQPDMGYGRPKPPQPDKPKADTAPLFDGELAG